MGSISKEKTTKNYKNQTQKAIIKPVEDNTFLHLRNLFLKTEEMRMKAETENDKIENRLIELKKRLSTTTDYINNLKTRIDGIKFPYSCKMIMEDIPERNKDEVELEIIELKSRIRKAQEQTQTENKVLENYQEAFNEVLAGFQKI